ncbi:MAG: gamma-glutamyltransferase family protein [Paracoccaceae bacterium]
MRDFELPGRSPTLATNGMVATSHPLAARAALRILEDGGNAVDAAIAGAVLLGIAEPQSTGIGGDLFALVKPAGEERVIALNGSGRAPMGLSAAALRAQGLKTIGTESPHSVTIPGAVDAFCRLSARFGRLGLADSLAPAIRYADQGIPIAPRVAFDWSDEVDWMTHDARRHFSKGGAPLATGDIFRAPGQAEVLRRIARDGRAAFYEGEVAEDMLAALHALGGTHSPDDFAATEATWGEPVAGSFAGHELLEHPPNGQGATAILMLNILKRFNLAALDPFGAARAHLEAEAAKLAYDARDRFIADPSLATRLPHILSADTADRLAALIDPARAMPMPPPGAEAVHRDTVLITVVDADRMAVSLIYSVFDSFGSGIASPKFGIVLQNRGAGFTLTERHPNEAGPGKRPLHTIIPAMLKKEGRVTVPFGVMGGHYQACGHARLVTNLLTYGMDVQEAIDGPRCFPKAGRLLVERGYSGKVRAELASLGHDLVAPDEPIGGAQAILIGADGVLWGGSDPRKDGCALGY